MALQAFDSEAPSGSSQASKEGDDRTNSRAVDSLELREVEHNSATWPLGDRFELALRERDRQRIERAHELQLDPVRHLEALHLHVRPEVRSASRHASRVERRVACKLGWLGMGSWIRPREGVLRSAAYTVATGAVARALGVFGTLALTRLVAPSDYGAATLACVLVGTVSTLTSPGLGQFVVAHPEASSDEVSHATAMHLTLGLLTAGIVFVIWLIFGLYPEAGGSSRYVPLLLLGSMLERIGYIPGRLLAREKQFKPLAMRLLYGELAYVTTALLTAQAGAGGWSIVYGTLVRALVTSALLVRACPRRSWLARSRPSLAVVRRLLAFGLPMSAANSLHWLSRRADNLLMGALFGPAAAGHYNLAYNLADIPATQLGEPVGDVLLPTFAGTTDRQVRHRALVRAARLVSLLISPLAVGLGAVAHTVVAFVLPPSYAEVAPMLAILAALSVTRPIGWLASAYLQARHRPRVVLLLEIFKVATLGIGMLGLSRFGPLWSCGAPGVAFGAHALASVVTLSVEDQVPLARLLGAVSKPALSSLAMLPPVWLAHVSLTGSATLGRLLVEVALGALTWLTVTLLFGRDDLAYATQLARARLSGKSPRATSR